MRESDVRELVRREPFEPIEFGLSDGRSVQVRHPDQIIVTHHKVIFGLAHVKGRRQGLSTPPSDAVAADWLLVKLMQVVRADPLNGSESGRNDNEAGKLSENRTAALRGHARQ